MNEVDVGVSSRPRRDFRLGSSKVVRGVRVAALREHPVTREKGFGLRVRIHRAYFWKQRSSGHSQNLRFIPKYSRQSWVSFLQMRQVRRGLAVHIYPR